MLSSDRICGPTRSGKAQYLSQLAILCVAFATPRFLSPVFTVSARNALGPCFSTHTRKKKKERKKEKERNAYILRVSQLKQTRLTSQFRPSTACKLILTIKLFSYPILLVNSLLQCSRTFYQVHKGAHCINPQFIFKSKECWPHLPLEGGVYTVAVKEKGF